MILLELFWSFFQIGLFSIGGGYAAMPLIQEQVVQMHPWLTMTQFADIMTIAEMTPGPIAINSATFVGYRAAGLLGSIAATLGVVLPSFVIILALSFVLTQFQQLTAVQYAFAGIRAGVLALLCKSLWTMYKKSSKGWPAYIAMAAAFILTSFVGVNILLVIAGCGIFGILTSLAMERRMQK